MLIVAIGFLVGVSLVFYGAMQRRQLNDIMSTRLDRMDLAPARSLSELELQAPRSERILGPIQQFLAVQVRKFTPQGTIEKTQASLSRAGNPSNMTVQDFLGLKGMAAVGTGIL